MKVLVVTSEWPSAENPQSGSFVKEQVLALQALGAEMHVHAFRGGRKLLNYLRSYKRLKQTLMVQRFDFIHAHFGQAGLLCCLQSRVPLIVTFHGSDLIGIVDHSGSCTVFGYILRTASRIAARHATLNILVSPALKCYLEDYNHVVVRLGLDVALFRPRSQAVARRVLGWSETEKVVLFVGSPNNAVKRHQLARKAVDLLLPDFPVTLKTVHGLAREVMPNYYNASDCLIITSFHESGPLCAREALACDVPIVSVRVGDVSRWVSGLEGCTVCDPDPIMLASALKIGIEQRPAFRGRHRVLELDSSRQAQKVLKIYELLERGMSPGEIASDSDVADIC